MVGADRVIVLATLNHGKLSEVQAVLGELGVAFVTLADFDPLPEAVEDGATFLANAEAKARHYSTLTGQWALADDSGLEVDYLGGEPGVYSARYAGPQRCDAANNAKLVEALSGVPQQERSARFRCTLALAAGRHILATASGVIEGLIVDQPAGKNGFGYDPHFFVPQFGLTTAQMPPEQKNRLSHRGQALRAIAPAIRKELAGQGAGPTSPPRRA